MEENNTESRKQKPVKGTQKRDQTKECSCNKNMETTEKKMKTEKRGNAENRIQEIILKIENKRQK